MNPNNLPPVFIVDDELVSKDYIEKLSPKNISSMEVLKGNSASVMSEKYGIPAGSGVVIIHTKK